MGKRRGSRQVRRALVGFVAVCLTVGGWAGSASAHVTIENDELPAGSAAVLHFQVPNESEKAKTVKVEIGLPTDVNIPSVTPRATPGWVVTTETRKIATPLQTDDGQVDEVVSKITFAGGTIPPGQFQTFDVAVEPLPDKPGTTIAFPTIQTYDDGTVVRWIDPVQPGQPEPDHPTPTVHLTSASGASTGDDDVDRGLAIAALVLGVIGAVTGVGALVVSRRRT